METWSRFRVQDSWRSPFTQRLNHHEIPIPLPTDDTRLVPLLVAALCAVIQTLQLVIHVWRSYTKSGHGEQVDEEEEVVVATGTLTRWQRIKNHVKWYGSVTIYAFLVARFVGSVALLVLSSVVLSKCRAASMWPPLRYISGCPEVLLTLTFVYTTFLSFLALVSKSWSTSSARYSNTILLSVFGLYIYRDIWPLATFYLTPEDAVEGWRMWAKIGTVVFTAVFIPLFIPRKYTPVDPKNPLTEPNPEQTASIISRATYSFLDPLIALGYRVAHLSHDQIPPLADYDYSQHQTKIGFPHMDVFYGAKRRHLFWGLLIHFRWDYIVLGVTVIIYALTTFSAPIGINQLLSYIETQGRGARIRPWFWIAWLFFGPIAQSFSFQYYIFVATRTLVRIEILITQLVFEHSLRIRLKAEAAGDEEGSGASGKNKAFSSGNTSEASTAAQSPDDRSIVSGDEEESDSVGSTVVSRQASDATAVAQGVAAAKKKDKKKAKEDEETEKKKEEKDTENVIGKINNLVSTDVGNITDGRDFLLLALYVPLQIVLCMTFLYRVLGWSAFIGLGVMIALFPLPGYVAKKLQDVQSQKMKKTDARIQAVTEAVNVLRMVKLFGWETKMSQKLRKKRDDELKLLWKYKLLDLANGLLSYLIPTLTMLVTFSAYTMVFKQELRASVIFPSMSVFSLLREQMQRIFWETSMIIQAKVSLDRVNEFLFKSELLDNYLKQISPTPALEITPPVATDSEDAKIGFNNATFTWSLEDDEDDGALTPSRRSFKLRVEGELLFKRNKINLIIGPTGAGKTSILMALLGEMHFVKNYPDAWFSLPREGGVAYASQESWVQNETIKNNILFGAEYDEERYKKVIKQCALERDLELFEAGDKTEVGERGLTLSGGQKARVTLARAIYSSAEIILLDDVLAALDVHTAAWIVDNCFRCDLVKGRTVLLVTHNVALASPVAEYIVTIGIDGSITAKGNDLKAALASDKKLAAEAQKDAEIVANAESELTSTSHSAESQPPAAQAATKAPDGKLMVAEEIVEGHVTWKSLKLLFTGLGGNHPILFFVTCVAGLAITDWCSTFQTWFLGYWAGQYETRPGSEVNSSYYLTIYSTLLAGAFVIYSATYFFFTFGAMRASRTINNRLVDSVFGSTLRWLDETPTGRIIARCTQDMRAIDGPVPQMFVWCLETTLSMITKLAVIVLFSPIFLFPGLGVAALGFYLGNMYLKAQLSVKREMSNARSPMLAHFSAAIHGLVSIRAYGAETAFKAESLKRINHYARIARTSYNLNRWIGIRIDGLGAIFTAALASYLVYGRSISASNTGFSLAMAVEFSLYILWVVRLYNEFEVQANSLERIQGYIDIEHEPKPTENGKPPAAWPTSGDLRVEKLVARYSPTGPKVLHEISFNVKSGERVGVVGRTGSGKSSLTLALLRCILTEGTVYYDDIATNTINLDALRSSITIIPQIPELLSGTLRQNLDPFNQNDDATLNDALRSAGLFSLQEDAGEARLSLDSKIAGGGANLSVGQRQILALARAMVRGSKLLILDEATSAIDYKTDSIIQSTLRRELPKDVTIITIAHRLQTIMDADKILVLDEGRIIEFDSPQNLLAKESGTLKDLVEGSGEKEALYALAEGRSL